MPRPEHSVLDGVFDSTDAGLIIFDRLRNILGWNQWMVSATGIPVREAEGKRLEDVFPLLANSRLAAAIEDAAMFGVSSMLTHTLHPVLFPLKTRDGRAMVHDVTVRQLAGDHGLGLIQIADVTVATERDRILRERQNARYDAVVESAPDAIVTLSSDGVIQMANPAAGRQFGYLAQELIGMPVRELLHDQDTWNAVWTSVLAGKPLSRPVELMARRKDGSLTYLEASASGWRSERRLFVTAILRDVNERRAAEEALRRLNQTLEQRVAERTADRDRMWRLSTDVMLVARLDGPITSANPAWRSLLGWNEPELIGHPLGEFVVPEDRPALRAVLGDMTHGQTTRLFELRLRHRNGGSRQIAWSAVVADDMLQAVGRDITAQREAQLALAKAEEALRQSQKMEALGQLTGGIAHDFNNLLTGILGAMDIMKRRIAARRYDDVQRFMDAASTSAHRAAALTHRLLAFARRQPLDPRPVDVNHLIRGMEDLLRRSVGEQVSLELNLAEGLWPAVTDANQLENALINLVVNGRDAMPNGGRLTIETVDVDIDADDQPSDTGFPRGIDHQGIDHEGIDHEGIDRGGIDHGGIDHGGVHHEGIDHGGIDPGRYTVIRVSDSGTGMTRETLARVFDPFFTTKPIGQGTGLGLSMVYGFARQSRGHVRIESEFGVGTRVRLYLPRHDQAATQRAEPASLQTMPRGAGETVLLVEDEPSVRLLLTEILRELGYASIEATNAETALPILASDVRLDLLITDVGLPGMNGRRLADIGREHRPNLRVLFVTGYAEHATKKTDFLAPGMQMVTKPFSLEAVAVTIRQMIEQRPP